MIKDFRGPYRWHSNFHLIDIEYEGLVYPSSEHAYQAAKTLDRDWDRKIIQAAPTPATAKRPGMTVQLRPDWESIKTRVMETILRTKFEDPELRQKLLDTGSEILIEGNYWHDNFWGTCICPRCGDRGENWLGKLLMKIRQEIQFREARKNIPPPPDPEI